MSIVSDDNDFQSNSIKDKKNPVIKPESIEPDKNFENCIRPKSFENYIGQSALKETIKITIDADPYKYKDTRIYSLNAIGGNVFTFESGRKRVVPVFDSNGFLKVIYNGKKIVLQKGAWSINDLQFKNGSNELYISSYEIRNCSWGDLKTHSVTWGQFKKKRLFEWYKSNGSGNISLEYAAVKK